LQSLRNLFPWLFLFNHLFRNQRPEGLKPDRSNQSCWGESLFLRFISPQGYAATGLREKRAKKDVVLDEQSNQNLLCRKAAFITLQIVILYSFVQVFLQNLFYA